MPEICRFYGIIIAMFYGDHGPPHFHARYGSHKIVIRIADLSIFEGKLPPRALGLVMEWAARRQDKLAQNWQAAQAHRPLTPIEPLD